MSHFPVAPKPKSLLGYHRVLAPTAGVKVSPICLGAMNFGDAWGSFMGECNKEQSFQIMDTFFDMGGNFIDTANAYQDEQSEEWIGEWMDKRKNRDQMVIATKYATGYRDSHRDIEPLQSNFVGNSVKSMHVSVNASLKKLKTDYIDLLYVHWWDCTTSVEEIMNGLNNLVTAGKVLYLGISDTPAWIVVKANEYAHAHGLRPFSVYQGYWSAAMRDMEREIIPMCEDQGMAIAPWGSLGRGNFRPAEQYKVVKEGGRHMGEPTENDIKVAAVLEDIAKSRGSNITGVAMAYVMHKTPNVFPILGGRKVEHLKSNISALSLQLSPEELEKIEDAVPFDAGFPMGFLFRGLKYNLNLTGAEIYLTARTASIDMLPKQMPIRPRTET